MVKHNSSNVKHIMWY